MSQGTPPADNPLIATPEKVGRWDGTGLFFDGLQSAKDLNNNAWVGIGFDAAADGMDALGLIADPFGVLAGAGIGWLIEHIPALREALDALAGNPEAINAKVETWSNVAAALQQSSSDYAASAVALRPAHTGDAAQAYQTAAANYTDIVSDVGAHAREAAVAFGVAGAAIGTLRAMIRDSIAQFCADAVIKFVVADAAAFFSFGASLAAWLADEVAEGASLALRNAAKITKLAHELEEVATRATGFAHTLDDVSADLRAASDKASTEITSLTAEQRAKKLEEAVKSAHHQGPFPDLDDKLSKLSIKTSPIGPAKVQFDVPPLTGGAEASEDAKNVPGELDGDGASGIDDGSLVDGPGE